MRNNLKTILKMKLNKHTVVFLCLFLTFGAFSQSNNTFPSIEVIGRDTVIIFTLTQGKKLAIINESNKECLLISEIQSEQLISKDSIIQLLERKESNYKAIISNNQLINQSNEAIINAFQEQEKILKKQLKSQIRMKVASLFVGVGTTIGVITYFLIR